MPKAKKRALIIGIQYEDDKIKLPFSHKYVDRVMDFLVNYLKWNSNDIIIMKDDRFINPQYYPTKSNIERELLSISSKTSENDTSFIFYTGHGGFKTHSEDDSDGKDGTIAPVDFHKSGFITDTDIKLHILNKLPEKCKFFAIFDNCRSEMLMDLPRIYYLHEEDPTHFLTVSRIKKKNSYTLLSEEPVALVKYHDKSRHTELSGSVICISCKLRDVNKDVFNGFLITSFIDTIKSDSSIDFSGLLTIVGTKLRTENLSIVISTSHKKNDLILHHVLSYL